MSELSEEEKQVLERLRQFEKDRAKIPAVERQPVASPGRFADPIGLDDEGNPFPVTRPPAKDSGEKK